MPHSWCHPTIPPSSAPSSPPISVPSYQPTPFSALSILPITQLLLPLCVSATVFSLYPLAVGFPFFLPPLLLMPTPLLLSFLLLSLPQPTDPVPLPSANSFLHLFGSINASNASLVLSSHHPCKPPPRPLFAVPKANALSPVNLLVAPTLCCPPGYFCYSSPHTTPPTSSLHRIPHTASLHRITTSPTASSLRIPLPLPHSAYRIPHYRTLCLHLYRTLLFSPPFLLRRGM
jgi:hypothetical protein